MNKLSIIASSTRTERIAGHVTRWVSEALAADWDVTVLDLAEIDLPFLDEPQMASTGTYTLPHTLAWKQAIDDADALVIVNAEYNGFPPPAIINAVDFLYAEWHDKPVAIIGYGFGGGARSATALTQLLGNVKADVVGSATLFFNTDLSLKGEMTVTDEKLAAVREVSTKLDAAVASSEAA